MLIDVPYDPTVFRSPPFPRSLEIFARRYQGLFILELDEDNVVD